MNIVTCQENMNHMQQNMSTRITCVYHKVGCTESFAHKDRIQHEKNNMQNHLLLAKEMLTEYKKNF